METPYKDKNGTTISIGDTVKVDCHPYRIQQGDCETEHVAVVGDDKFFPDSLYPYTLTPRQHYSLKDTQHLEVIK